MPSNASISHRESLPSDVFVQEPHDTEQDATHLDEAASRQLESTRKRVCVLLGSAILQLPIWGRTNPTSPLQLNSQTQEPMASSKRTIPATGPCKGVPTSPVSSARPPTASCTSPCRSCSRSSPGNGLNTSNRAVAYGVVLSCKNIVGSACPFLLRFLLDRYGFRTTLRIWTAIAAGTSIPAIFLILTHPSSISSSAHRTRKTPWHFLRHQTFYIYSIGIILQSSGYGIPQTYLNTYAHEVTLLSQTSATLLLTLFNIPGVFASSLFGYVSDNKHFPLSATTVTFVSAISSALSAFLLWGLTSQGSMALLVLFSITFGFFAGGYSATWGGVINELELEAAQSNEAVDKGMLYGLLNGARGIGYVSGGLAGVPLLKAGSKISKGGFGYGTTYGPLIIFTGLSSVFGGWGLL